MEVIEIPVKKEQWLTDALKAKTGDSNIPSNAILNKFLPGLGATYSEIYAKRHSIIVEPNVPVIFGKANKNKDILAVYGNIKESDIRAYLQQNEPRYKKLMTTPDSFWKIKKAAKDANVDIFRHYFFLFDECEKITQEIKFRKKIAQPIADFFSFEHKAFVSATPLDMTHPKFEEQGFKIYKVKPEFDYSKNIELFVTEHFYEMVKFRLDELKESKCICIFFDSITAINKIITTFGINEESKIFCSAEKADDLRKKDFKNTYSDIDLPLAKYNFFTSRFYSAVDIDLEIQPDVILLTDLSPKPRRHSKSDSMFTMIDPFTESIQIQGRFRNKNAEGQNIKSLAHITTIKPSLAIEIKTKEEIDRELDVNRNIYNNLKIQLETAEVEELKTIEKNIDALPYNEYLDSNGNINPFVMDNLYNDEKVKGYYTSQENFMNAYKHTRFFYGNLSALKGNVAELSIKITKATSYKQQVKLIIDCIERMLPEDVEIYRNGLRPHFGDIDFILAAYQELGRTDVLHNKATIEKLLADKKKKTQDKKTKAESFVTPEILQDIHLEFNCDLGKEIPRDEFKERLQTIFSLHLLNENVSNASAKKYFKATEAKTKNPYYKLSHLLPEHQLKLSEVYGMVFEEIMIIS